MTISKAQQDHWDSLRDKPTVRRKYLAFARDYLWDENGEYPQDVDTIIKRAKEIAYEDQVV